MTHWFQTQHAARLFPRPLFVGGDGCSCLADVQGIPFLTRRAIIQGGFAYSDASPEAVSAMMVRVRRRAADMGCVYAEMRCFGDYNLYREVLEGAGWTYVPHYDITLDVAAPLPEAKERQVRALERQGYTWRLADCEDDVRAFYRCLRHLYRTKVHRPLPSYSFFLRAWSSGIPLLIVESPSVQRSISGGVLLPIHQPSLRAYEWYICGDLFATWAMIAYCRERGVPTIDLMGAGEPGVPYGVRDFKLQMGGHLHEWGRYLAVLRPATYRLGFYWIHKKHNFFVLGRRFAKNTFSLFATHSFL